MRIWIINHYGLPPSGSGGTRHYNFARLLQQRGHEVLIIAANFHHFSQGSMVPDDQVGKIDRSHNVPFIWLPVPTYKGNTLSRFWNMLVFGWQIVTSPYLRTLPVPDVIIGSSPHLFAALGAERLAKRLKKPFVLEIRDLWPESLVDLGRFTHHHPLIKLMQKVEVHLYRKARQVISLLPSANQYLIDKGVKAAAISWIPNSVDIDNIPTTLPQQEANKKFTVMYAGAHGVANDLDTVIAAAKLLEQQGYADKIRICLIGEGPEKNRLKMLAATDRLTLIEFMDPVPKNQIYTILHAADTFLMLLKDSPVFRWGISPNKLFDYLIMGRPVIFGVNTPFNPVATYDAGISIQPGNAVELAEAIQRLSQMPRSERHAMGQRGREFVLQQHYLPILTDTLESVLTVACRESHEQFSA